MVDPDELDEDPSRAGAANRTRSRKRPDDRAGAGAGGRSLDRSSATTAELTVAVRPPTTSRSAGRCVAAWVAVVLAGLACLVAALVPVGPSYLEGIGAVAVASAYAWALAARTGGRPVDLRRARAAPGRRWCW